MSGITQMSIRPLHAVGRKYSTVPLIGAWLLATLLAGCGGSTSGNFDLPHPGPSSSSSSGGTTSGGSTSSSSGSSTSSSGGSTSSSSGGTTSSSGASSGASSSSGVTAQFWIPYSASPSSSGGQTGLFVIPSGALTTNPAFVNSSAVQLLAEGPNVDVNGNNVIIAASPGTFMYAAVDSNNNIHVYGLTLSNPTNSTTAPSQTQIGSLSLPLTPGNAISTVICPDSSGLEASTNFRDPTTVFVVVHVAGTTGCNTTGDVWEVVHYTDSVSTAPIVLSIEPAYFAALYGPSGSLAGVAVLDSSSGNLQLYSDDTFTSPSTLVASVTAVNTLYNNIAGGGGTTLFLGVTTGAGQFVYQLPYSQSTATKVYTAQGTLSSLGVSDDNNVYFTDTATTSGPFTPGAVTMNGTISAPSHPGLGLTGSISGNGTAVLSGNTLTVTEPATSDGTNLGGTATISATDVFTGTFSSGTFTAASGTQAILTCAQVSGNSCANTPLVPPNSPTPFVSASGTVTAAGGVITVVGSGAGGLAVIDETYTFAAGSAGSATTATSLLQESLAGGTPTQLYSSSTGFELIGANDAVVVFSTTGSNTASLFTVPVNTLSSNATPLGTSSYAGSISSGTFMQPSTAGSFASSLLYLTVTASGPTSYSSEVLSPDGTVKQALTANSAFLAHGTLASSGSVLQAQNIGTSGGYGGGTIAKVTPADLSGGALGGTSLSTTSGGSAYTVPANTLPFLVGASNTIGIGLLESLGGGTTLGLAVDLSQNLIEPIGGSLNSSISLF